MDPLDDRELEARLEMAATRLPRPVALALAAGFGLLLLSPPLVELTRAARSAASPWMELARGAGNAARALRQGHAFAANRALDAGLEALENGLEESSFLRAVSLPVAQGLISGVLRGGSDQVRVGGNGWLFFQPDVELATRAAPGVSALPALLALQEDLAARGIELLVVPAPSKVALHPEELGSATPAGDFRGPAFATFLAAAEEAGLEVLDPTPLLAAAAQGAPQSLARDSHWSPAAVERVAGAVAERLRREGWVPPPDGALRERRALKHSGVGDLVALLGVADDSPLAQPETVSLHQVHTATGELLKPLREAPVLLLGDSFTNVFSQAGLGWGEGAGLAEQLAFELGLPVDRLVENAGGAAATRRALAAELARGEDRLAGKRVVVYEFAARELLAGDWPVIRLATPAERTITAELSGGFAVWESNRTGSWRLWWKRLAGGSEAQLSREEPGMEHCCPHVAPDGKSLVYLARAGVRDAYPEVEVAGELRLLSLADGRERSLGPAKTYGWGNRAAVWRGLGELIYVGADGRTMLLELATGTSQPLTLSPRPELGWLLDPSLSFATQAAPSFSLYDSSGWRVLERGPLGGCEPYFSADGRWGYWIAGGGGPLRRIRLEDRQVSILIAQNDTRLPEGRRYLYFPMLSANRRFLAYGASNGDHHHFRADYDIFIVPVDPATLELAGPAVRVSAHPATDRYPDLWVPPLPGDESAAVPPPPGSRRPAGPLAEEPPWPASLDGLAFVWARADQPNLVRDRERGELVTLPVTPAGAARFDHNFAMQLGEGRFVATEGAASRLRGMLGASRALTLEATLTAAQARTARFEPALRFGGEVANFALGQDGGSWVVELLAGPRGDAAPPKRLALLPVAVGVPQQLAVTYSRGELRAFLDGREVLTSRDLAGGFARWGPGELTFGGSGFEGRLEGVALWSRVLSAEEIAESARRFQALAARSAPVAAKRVEARLLACSEPPTLAEITPYRQALIVCAWQAGTETLRVAHFALLDGERQPILTQKPGTTHHLTLEPFATQRQLEGVVLRDTLPAPEGGGLWFAVNHIAATGPGVS